MGSKKAQEDRSSSCWFYMGKIKDAMILADYVQFFTQIHSQISSMKNSIVLRVNPEALACPCSSAWHSSGWSPVLDCPRSASPPHACQGLLSLPMWEVSAQHHPRPSRSALINSLTSLRSMQHAFEGTHRYFYCILTKSRGPWRTWTVSNSGHPSLERVFLLCSINTKECPRS